MIYEARHFRIKQSSWPAALAALMLRSDRMAIVIGKTIHLHRVSMEDFLRNKRWLNHELCHVAQFRKYGFLKFMLMYMWETLRRGYVNNRFEAEAREFALSAP